MIVADGICYFVCTNTFIIYFAKVVQDKASIHVDYEGQIVNINVHCTFQTGKPSL